MVHRERTQEPVPKLVEPRNWTGGGQGRVRLPSFVCGACTLPGMTRAHVFVSTVVVLALLGATGCKKEPEPEPEPAKKEDKAPPPAPDLTPAEPQFDLSGPTPPATSTVLFTVDGALLPLACFDKDKNTLVAGTECGKLVAEGSEVYMESSFGKKALEKTTAGTKPSTCGDEGALPSAHLDTGADYDWAVWPKSLGPTFVQIKPDTWSDRGARLEDAEAQAVQAAIAKVRASKGEFQPRQKASVDIDGDGKDELFVSAVLVNPKDPDAYLFSGLFMAPGGDLAALQLIDKASKGVDEIKLFGVVDLDGDGKRELWTGISFEGGAGERVVQLGAQPKSLGKWTCGAGG